MDIYNHDPLWFSLHQTPTAHKLKNKWQANEFDMGTQGKAESVMNEQIFLCVAQYLPVIPVNIKLHTGSTAVTGMRIRQLGFIPNLTTTTFCQLLPFSNLSLLK